MVKGKNYVIYIFKEKYIDNIYLLMKKKLTFAKEPDYTMKSEENRPLSFSLEKAHHTC